jgi:hypothetical protein
MRSTVAIFACLVGFGALSAAGWRHASAAENETAAFGQAPGKTPASEPLPEPVGTPEVQPPKRGAPAADLPGAARQAPASAGEQDPAKSAKKKRKQKKQPADDPARRAAETLSQVDEDFAYQGEYMGRVPFVWWQSERIGVQVVARGSGKFEANLLRGGLPGAGWDRRSKGTMKGQRQGANLVLENELWSLSLDGRNAAVQPRDGQPGVSLDKYHRISATQDARPPYGAKILFDGRTADGFQNAQLTDDRLLRVGTMTKDSFGDFQLHLEFRLPYMPAATGQGRGNSGVYIQQRYEVQILDSFGLEGVENECGGLYRQKAPLVNMCLPPLSWQTYDIYFVAARWDADGTKRSDARITVLHNGQPIHWNYALTGKTGSGKPEGPQDLPILLQDHGNPVTFRNIWIVASPPAAREPGGQVFLGARLVE